MVKVENKKTIQALTKRFIRTYKKNTVAMTLAITLLIALIVSLLILLHTNHWIEALQNQFIYTNIDVQVSRLEPSQIKLLEEDRDIERLGVKRYKARVHTGYQRATVISANNAAILETSKLVSGEMPKGEHEVVAEKWALLNLGINPVIGSKFTLETAPSDSEQFEPVSYKVVGIIHDISLNKLSGSLNLYTCLDESKTGDYFAEIKFKDGTDREVAIERIKNRLGLSPKSISKNPWGENKGELIRIDMELEMLLLLISFVILWGIYRISLLARESQYGILRAVGVTKGQIRIMILSELLKIYRISIPIGIVSGVACSHLVTLLSHNDDMELYFWGERQIFQMVVPVPPIVLCIGAIGIVLVVISLLGSHKVNDRTIMEAILGSPEDELKDFSIFAITEKDDSFMSARLGFRYIFCKFRTSIIIILSLAIGGSLFYGLAYRATLYSAETTIKTEENFYNSDYLLTANDDMSATQGITVDTVNRAKEIPEVTTVETQRAMPVKVIDDEHVNRIEDYFADREKMVKKIYGFSLKNSFGSDSIFHTKLKGYNEEALKKLKNYVVEGDFDPAHMKPNEIIIAMPRMSESGKSKGTVNFFKKGKPIMEYKVGQRLTVKYRTDLDTTSNEYWQCKDDTNQYSTVNYKIAAIAYYPYMKEVSVTEQAYPLLITNENNYDKVNPTGVYETVNLNIEDQVTEKRQDEIEQEFIQLSVENQQVTARSLIAEKAKLDMMYQKALVYIYGIAIVTFILVLINLINSLNYRIQTRKSELYIFRAIGMDLKFQSKMILFENMMFGLFSLILIFISSHVLTRYLYADSGIYQYGISYAYNPLIFNALTGFTLIICYAVSKLLCNPLKDESILTELNKTE